MRNLALGALLASLAAAPLVNASSSAPPTCESLKSLALTDVTVTAVVTVDPHPSWSPAPPPSGTPARTVSIAVPFCRVQGIIEKEIGFEVWLPTAERWNHKLLGAGVGGDAGTFNFADLPRGINRGYAAATTDTGHKNTDPAWMLGDPMRLTNYELRANHRLAEVSKQLIARFYGEPPQRSYFIGCSGGGRQGLKELQRFPDDYDGIISGANGPKTPEMTVRRMWELARRDQNPGLMSPADWQLIAREGVKACDRLDGVEDGVAEDPRACRFDIGTLQCQGETRTNCLTPQQVAFAKGFYEPLRDEQGRTLDQGLLPGILVDSGRSRLALGTFGHAIRHDPDWNGQGFTVAADLAAIDRVMPELRADDTDLTRFRKRGGKILMYQGWLDPAVAARMATAYYDAVQARIGNETDTTNFMRLFMLPGVYHCSGGPGPDQVGGAGSDAPIVDADHDMLTALERWVEQGIAPERLVVSKVTDGKVVRTRPVCVYPARAEYRGTGSTDEASSFRCVRPVTPGR